MLTANSSNTSLENLGNAHQGLRIIDLIYVIIGTVVFMGNFMTIVLVASFHELRTKTNFILASLAAVDCLTGFVGHAHGIFENIWTRIVVTY